MRAGTICSTIKIRLGQLRPEFPISSCDNQRKYRHVTRLIVRDQFESIFQQRSKEYLLRRGGIVLNLGNDIVTSASNPRRSANELIPLDAIRSAEQLTHGNCCRGESASWGVLGTSARVHLIVQLDGSDIRDCLVRSGWRLCWARGCI